jgi:hypothetical protein
LRNVLQLSHVDVGGGWLIFGLPPAEVAVHPSDKNDVHEFYLMCRDIQAFVAEMAARKIACEPVKDEGWRLLSQMYVEGKRDRLPRAFAGGRKVYLAHIFVYRDDLPGKKLRGRRIPCALFWDDEKTMICTRPPSKKKRRRLAEDDD